MGKWRGQSNKVCFTINNYSAEVLEAINNHFDGWFDEKRIAYGIIGEESGDSGTLHLQGFVRLARSFKKSREVCSVTSPTATTRLGGLRPHLIYYYTTGL